MGLSGILVLGFWGLLVVRGFGGLEGFRALRFRSVRGFVELRGVLGVGRCSWVA